MFQDFDWQWVSTFIAALDWQFWLTVFAAAAIKVSRSGGLKFLPAIATGGTAIFCAAVGTEPAAHYLGIEEPFTKYALAALIALTGEGLIRLAIDLSDNPREIISLWKQWRGK